MQVHRTRSWLIILAVLVGGATVAKAQTGGAPEPPPDHTDFQPFHPIGLDNLADMQIWKPYVDDGSEDCLWKGNYGPFFRYERFYWSIFQPRQTTIGTPNQTLFGLSEDTTGFMKANFVWGNRFELGYWMDDNYGWDSTIIKSNNQYNSQDTGQPTHVAFVNEPVVGFINTPLLYSPLEENNTTRFVGVDLLKTFRYEPTHSGGLWSVGLGAKYFQLHDRFTVAGTTVPTTSISTVLVSNVVTTSLTGSTSVTIIDTTTVNTEEAPNYWSTSVDNNIVGPEMKLEWEDKQGRWTFGAEFRFTPAANFETVKQVGALGAGTTSTTVQTTTTVNTTNLSPPTITTNVINQIIAQSQAVVPAGFATNSFSHTLNQVAFAPIGELRLDTAYELTKAASIRVGYTGTLIGGVGRASQRVDYTFPDMGILPGPKQTHTYINGVNVGFDINY